MSLVSILIPTYNVGNLLDRCLNSIMNQTYKNFEIIIVDDGSTDQTMDVIHKYLSSNRNIHLYRCDSFGISFARNKLLEKANGDYLMFVDGDDYIEPETLQTMMDISLNDGCDIVSCGYTMDYGVCKFRRNICETGFMTQKEAIHSLVENTGFNNYLWGKLYKKECWNNVTFPANMKSFEDTVTIFKVLANAQKIGNIKKRFYHYVQRNGSLTSHMSLSTTYDMRNAYSYQEKVLNEMYPDDNFNFNTHYYNMDLYILYTLLTTCHRKDRNVFLASDINWENFSPVKKGFYNACLGVVKIKLGKNFKTEVKANDKISKK